MTKLLAAFKSSALFATIVSKLISWLAGQVGTAIKNLAISRGIPSETAETLDTEVSGLIVTLGTLAALSWEKPATIAPTASEAARKDAVVRAQINQVAADSAVVADRISMVKDAMTKAAQDSPTTMQGVLDQLEQGHG